MANMKVADVSKLNNHIFYVFCRLIMAFSGLIFFTTYYIRNI